MSMTFLQFANLRRKRVKEGVGKRLTNAGGVFLLLWIYLTGRRIELASGCVVGGGFHGIYEEVY